MTIKESLNILDTKAIDSNEKFLDLRNLYEAANLDYEKKKKLKELIDKNEDPEVIAAYLVNDGDDSTLDESILTEDDLHDVFRKDAKNQYRSFSNKLSRYEKEANEFSDLLGDIPNKDEKIKKFLGDEPKFKLDKGYNHLERQNFPYYVTHYEGTSFYHPEEGGYYVGGLEPDWSEGFESFEEAVSALGDYLEENNSARVSFNPRNVSVMDDNYAYEDSTEDYEEITDNKGNVVGAIARGKYIGEEDQIWVESNKEYLSRQSGDRMYESLNEAVSNGADFLVPIVGYTDERLENEEELDRIGVSLKDVVQNSGRKFVDICMPHLTRDNTGELISNYEFDHVVRKIAFAKWQEKNRLSNNRFTEDDYNGYGTGKVIVLNTELIPDRVQKLGRFLGKKLLSNNKPFNESYKLRFYHKQKGLNQGNLDHEEFFDTKAEAVNRYKEVFDRNAYSLNPTVWVGDGDNWKRLSEVEINESFSIRESAGIKNLNTVNLKNKEELVWYLNDIDFNQDYEISTDDGIDFFYWWTNPKINVSSYPIIQIDYNGKTIFHRECTVANDFTLQLDMYNAINALDVINESLNESSYGDTTIEDYINTNFSGSVRDKKKFIDAMKKKANGKDYFNGLNMSVKDWEKQGQKFGLSMKKYPVTEGVRTRNNMKFKNKKKLIESVESPEFSAYITNLGKYNEGELIGEWVQFPIDEDDFEEVLKKIGIGSKDEFGQPYEEWFVTDYDCNLNGFDWQELGEYPSYETLQEFGELVDGIDDVEAVNNAYEVTGDLKEAIDGLDSGRIIYYPGVENYYALAEYIIDEFGGVEELDRSTIEDYFDYEALGRDLSFDSYESEDEDGNEIEVSAGEYFCGDEGASDYDIGEAFVNDVGFDGVGNIESYFDFHKYGRDLSYEGFTLTHDGAIEYQ